MKKRGNKNEKRNILVPVRLTKTENEVVIKRQEKAGYPSKASFFRECGQHAFIIERAPKYELVLLKNIQADLIENKTVFIALKPLIQNKDVRLLSRVDDMINRLTRVISNL